MKRSGMPRRTKPMNRRAMKSRPVRRDDKLETAKRLVRSRSAGRCEAGTEVCEGRVDHVHHRLMRSQGGGHDASNLLAVCSACHTHIHANPAEAYDRGWLWHAGNL